jgi:hypothetical protein
MSRFGKTVPRTRGRGIELVPPYAVPDLTRFNQGKYSHKTALIPDGVYDDLTVRLKRPHVSGEKLRAIVGSITAATYTQPQPVIPKDAEKITVTTMHLGPGGRF